MFAVDCGGPVGPRAWIHMRRRPFAAEAVQLALLFADLFAAVHAGMIDSCTVTQLVMAGREVPDLRKHGERISDQNTLRYIKEVPKPFLCTPVQPKFDSQIGQPTC